MTNYVQESCVLQNSTNKLNYICKPTNRIKQLKMDDKEAKDRLMAAEAMSALASLVLTKSTTISDNTQTDNKPNTRKKPSRKRGDKAKGGSRKSNKVEVADRVANKNNNNSSSNFNPGSFEHNRNKTKVSKHSHQSRNSKSRKLSTSTTIVDGSEQFSTKIPKTVTQCTQTGPTSENFVNPHSINLADLHLISGNIFPSTNLANFQLTSLPTIPSIDALKLPSNIDLSAFPNLNTVNIVLGGLAQQHDQQSDQEPGKSEGERSLPFKKRRYANSIDSTRNNSSTSTNSQTDRHCDNDAQMATVSSTSPHTSSSKSPDYKLRSSVISRKTVIDGVTLKLNPFGTQLMSEILIALRADEDGDLPLHIAVVHENIPMIKKFIQLMKLARKSVDKFNKQTQTPLHLSIKLNLEEAIKVLLEAEADVNYVDQTGCTSLHLSVKHRLPHLIHVLYKHSKISVDVNTRNFDGFTPLHTAVEMNDDQMINILIDKGMDIDMLDGKSGRTALYHAVESDKRGIVCLLLKRGANPEIQNYAGNTAIMAAHARSLRGISSILTFNTSEIPDYELNSIEVKMEETNDKNMLIETLVSASTLPFSATDVKPSAPTTNVLNENIPLIDSDQPLDLHVHKKLSKIPNRDNVQQTYSIIRKSPTQTTHTSLTQTNHTSPTQTAHVGLTQTTNTSPTQAIESDSAITISKLPSSVSAMEENFMVVTKDNNVAKAENSSAIRERLMLSNVQSSSVPGKIPSVVPEVLRPAAVIPPGLISFINPQLKAKIQQNLMNKQLKAHKSEEKKE